MTELQPDETDLLVKWEFVGGEVVADETSKRITTLTSSFLKKIADGKSCTKIRGTVDIGSLHIPKVRCMVGAHRVSPISPNTRLD
ncbi:MAG TPA: hypothetical protein VE863_22320 [Pyrinomonadaceae bacterium]|jgi:hypothetical protein|nr:hypothetical protein [Pyrinomonadaceae bacterium]